MEDKETDGKSYSQTDYLAQIGFQAQPGDIYYMNPPKELSSYPMYIDSPKKIEKTFSRFFYCLYLRRNRYYRKIGSKIQ